MQILTALFRVRDNEQSSQPADPHASAATPNSTNNNQQTARLYLSYPFYLHSRVPLLPG
jgi:hypothetical protein